MNAAKDAAKKAGQEVKSNTPKLGAGQISKSQPLGSVVDTKANGASDPGAATGTASDASRPAASATAAGGADKCSQPAPPAPAAHDLFAQHDLIDVQITISMPSLPLAPAHTPASKSMQAGSSLSLGSSFGSASSAPAMPARKGSVLNLEDYKRKRGLI